MDPERQCEFFRYLREEKNNNITQNEAHNINEAIHLSINQYFNNNNNTNYNENELNGDLLCDQES